ncbi:hypothetical protein LIER_13524 [Lithospermum erythrorhizon]|uniref:Uncharacterized protein n=1 Tax=Lithospermum erythrorhizon TaxID=34254 RepID=A0AAV3PW71_LITER
MDQNVVMIPDVKPELDHWMVRVTITEEMPTFIGYKNGTRYKRYIFTDDQGNTVPAIVFATSIYQCVVLVWCLKYIQC